MDLEPEGGSNMGTRRRTIAGRGLPSVGAWATMLTLWLPGEIPAAEAALTASVPGVFLPPLSEARPDECLNGSALPGETPESSGR